MLIFTVQSDYPRGAVLFKLINKAFKIAQSSADVVQFQCKKYPEQAPYPEAQEELK